MLYLDNLPIAPELKKMLRHNEDIIQPIIDRTIVGGGKFLALAILPDVGRLLYCGRYDCEPRSLVSIIITAKYQEEAKKRGDDLAPEENDCASLPCTADAYQIALAGLSAIGKKRAAKYMNHEEAGK